MGANEVRRLRRENDIAERRLIPLPDAVDALSAAVGLFQTELSAVPFHATDGVRMRLKIETVIDNVVNGHARQVGSLARKSKS